MTAVESPAATLRRAAEKIRKLAAQSTGAPWETTWRGQEYHLDGYRDGDLEPISEWTYAIATWEPEASEQRAECDTANADYMAAMHPGVGLALAEWLDTVARHCADGYVCCDSGEHRCETVAPALSVARAVLGGGS